MTREHASKGFKVVSDTSATPKNFYGFTVLSDTVISEIDAPTQRAMENTAYDADYTGIAGQTLPPGYYPIRGSSITLSSGEIILWIE